MNLVVNTVVNGAVLAIGAALPWKIAMGLGLVSGSVNSYEGISGNTIGGRKLSGKERILRGVFGTLDLALAGYSGVKGFKNRGSKVPEVPEKAGGLTKTQKVENFQKRGDKLREQMPNKRLRADGNVAIADVQIDGLKNEYVAHSGIHSDSSKGYDLADFSVTKDKKALTSYVDDRFPRFNDTEAKILEDIASKIDFNTKGVIDLYTELPTCQSCTNLILEFRYKYPKVTLNIYTKY
ncbi:deaminase domain-containing protein [Carnobacterium gallinarum]|uniref:deaminase domain-containing protein n=1 Tax=Carnobacterium gallinarum TaxID=2749 RepID=UPI001FE04D11|nr:deaminase domain-containing protein [Carnobacterium gallinarum]